MNDASRLVEVTVRLFRNDDARTIGFMVIAPGMTTTGCGFDVADAVERAQRVARFHLEGEARTRVFVADERRQSEDE